MWPATLVQSRYPRTVFYVITGLLVVDMTMGLHLVALLPWATTVYNAGRNTSAASLRWVLVGFNAFVFLWVFVLPGQVGQAVNGLLQVAITSLIAMWWGSEVRAETNVPRRNASHL